MKKISTQLLICLISISLFSGCQLMQDSAQNLRNNIDQTVNKAQNTLDSTKEKVQNGIEQTTQTVNDAKYIIDTKVQQINETGEKINQAKDAIDDASQAIKDVTSLKSS